MEIFKLFGSIMVDSSKADESISKTTKKAGGFAEKLGTGIKTAAKWGAAIVTGTTAAVGGMVKFAEKTASTADNIDKMSQKMGLSRTAFQELDFILSQSGADINSFGTGMKSLLSNMDKVSEGNKTATANFEALGISVQNTDGSLRNQEDVMWDTIKAFQGMKDSAEKSRLAQELFGKQGQELMPLLNGEAGSLEEMKEKAHELGLVMSDETIDAGVKLTDTMDQLKRGFGAIVTQIGAKLIPIVQKGAEKFIEFLPAIRNVASNAREALAPAFNFVSNAVNVVKDVFVALADYWTNNILPVIQFVVTEFMVFVEMVYTAIQPAIMDIVSFFQQLYEAVVNAVQQYIMPAIESYIQMLLQLYDENKDKLEKIMTLVKTIFDVIAGFVAVFIDIIKNYIIPFFAWIVSTVTSNMDSIKATIQSVINLISAIIDAFIALFTGNWKGLWESIKSILSAALDVVKNAFNTAFTFICNVFSPLKSFFSGIWNGIKGVFINAGTWFGNVFKTAVDNIKTFFSPLTDFFSQMWSKITSIFKDVGVAIGEGISGAVRNAVNGILGGAARIINGFIDAMNVAIGIVNGIPGVPDISQISHLPVPQLEKGGVLEKGEIGLLEGNGAEAVVPLDQNKKWISAVAKDMSNAIGGSNNNEEVEKTLAAVNQTLKELPKMIFNALTSGDIKFEVGSREFARLVKVVNT